jgi:hypothetical protein
MAWIPETVSVNISSVREPYERSRMFVKETARTVLNAGRARIRTLDWKPPPKIELTSCMLCTLRPIDRVSEMTALNSLGLTELANHANRKLAQQLREMP